MGEEFGDEALLERLCEGEGDYAWDVDVSEEKRGHWEVWRLRSVWETSEAEGLCKCLVWRGGPPADSLSSTVLAIVLVTNQFRPIAASV